MLEFTKILVYTSFVLYIACGVGVFFGIFGWVRDLRKN